MNRAPSKYAAATGKAPANRKPKKQIPRSPLKDLNGGVFKTTSSTSTSIEAPRGCLRFLISNSSSSSSSSSFNSSKKTPPESNSRNPRNPTTHKPRLRSCNQRGASPAAVQVPNNERKVTRLPLRWQQGNKMSSGNAHKEMTTHASFGSQSGSGRLEQPVKACDGKTAKDIQFTPVACRMGSGSEFGKELGSSCHRNDSGNGNTPPAEITVSPEIQCGSNVMSATTPICFAAGHVLSGVSDKRKCRPRGVLVVGDNCSGIDGLSISDEGIDGIGYDKSGHTMVVPPLPAEASMHWLLSPCDEEVDLSPLSRSSGERASREEGFASQFDDKIYSNLPGQPSPCSVDTLGSENIIQTPESNSSTEMHLMFPWSDVHDQKHGVESNFACAADGRQRTCFSPEGQITAPEHMDSGFEFDCLLKTASSVEFSQLQHNWDKSALISDVTVENEPRPWMRISSKDGSSSHIFEMDDPDNCRCLSDEEYENGQDSSDSASPEPKVPEINTESFMKIFDVKSTGCVNKRENSLLQKEVPCAESISLDGGSLAASGDSGWDMCYKNDLFRVEP